MPDNSNPFDELSFDSAQSGFGDPFDEAISRQNYHQKWGLRGRIHQHTGGLPDLDMGFPKQNPKGPTSWYEKFARDMFNTDRYYGSRLQSMVNEEVRPTAGQANQLRYLVDQQLDSTPKDALGTQNEQLEVETAKWYHRAASTVGAGAMTVLDYLSRGNYASAKFFDIMASDGWMAFGKAMSAAASEAYDPQFRMTFSDVIKNQNPGLYEASPLAAETLGFIGDIVLDPTTYLTFGTTSLGAKVAPKIISKGTKYGDKLLSLTKKGEHFYQQRLIAWGGDQERAIESVSKAINMGMDVVYEQAPKKFGVGIKLPFTKGVEARVKLPGTERGRAFMDWFKQTNVGEAMSKKFLPIKKIPAEHIRHYVRQRDEIVKAFDKEEKRAIERFEYIWRGLGQESLEKIGRTANTITQNTDAYIKTHGASSLGPHGADEIMSSAISYHGLNEKETTALARAMQTYQDLYRLEKEAGLTFEELVNYHPRMYNITSEGITQAKISESIAEINATPGLSNRARQKQIKELLERQGTGLERQRQGYNVLASDNMSMSKRFKQSFEKERRYDTLEDAIADGFVPELDAAKMMSRRWTASVRARRDTMVTSLYEGMKKSGKYSKSELSMIRRDMQNVGAVSVKPYDSDFANYMLKGWDGFLSVFRRSATIARPGFAVRTLTDNLARNFLVKGIRGFGNFSPETQRVVWPVLQAMHAPGYEGLEKIVVRSPLGDVYDGRQLKDMFEQYNVATGRAMGVGKSFKAERNLERELMRVHKDLAFADKGDAVAKGKKQLLKTMHHYWNWSGYVEDWTRASSFTNGLLHGYTPEAAAKMTNDVYFDYLNGLSPFENGIMKRVVPFYTFNRFIFPQLFKGITQTPGRAAAIKKTADYFFTAVNKVFADEGEQLNDNERFALPGWLLEQPHTYLGMGQDMKAHFAAFNNFTPIDTIGFLEMKKTGNEIDMGRSVIKQFLSSVAPMIKIPFEWATNRNLFTDRVIESTATEVGTERLRLGPMTEKPFEAFDRMFPEEVKQAIGFEIVTDPRDGKRKAYVNPYLMHTMKSMMPVLNDVVRVLDDRLTPRETAVSILAGVSQYKLDLKQQATYRRVELQKIQKEKMEEIKQARKQGRFGTEAYLWNELQSITRNAAAEWKKLDLDKIRGSELDPEVPGNTGYRASRWGDPRRKDKW